MAEPLLWAALGGLLIGLFLTIFGGGGSVLAVPWLVYAVGVGDTHVAIGTSAAAVAVNALAGLVGQWRSGRVKWPCATVFAVTGVAGALAGAALGKRIDGTMLLYGFALVMIAIALSMLVSRKSEGDAGVQLHPALMLRLVPAGFAVGAVSGLFGIGGGFLIAPGLMAATGMTLAHASASSLLSVTLFGSATSASYAFSGLVDWALFGALVAGGVGGVLAGLPLARLLAERTRLARTLFALLIIMVAVYIFLF